MREKVKYIVRVYHNYYGCETGCCGHRIEVIHNDKTVMDYYDFSHPHGEDKKAWAIELAKIEIGRKSPACLESIDWENIDVEDVRDDC